MVGFVSIFTNLLMLTGPVFMLQVYDRVLSSRSEATLVVLFALVAFCTLCSVCWTMPAPVSRRAPGRSTSCIWTSAVFRVGPGRGGHARASRHLPVRATQDVALLQQITGSPVFLALFDFPWVPLFIGVIALLHPVLGLFAGLAALALAAMSFVNMQRSRARQDVCLRRSNAQKRSGRQISMPRPGRCAPSACRPRR